MGVAVAANGRGRELLLDGGQPGLVVATLAGAMGLPVGFQTGNGSVALVARVAHIGLLSMMDMGVQFHMDSLGILVHAGRAAVWFLAGMQPEVSLEIRGRAEPLPAHLALVWLFT